MTKLRIKFMSDDALAYLRRNATYITQQLRDNPETSEWLSSLVDGNLYEAQNCYINAPLLEVPENEKDRATDYKNSISIHESLSELPKYVLGNERFWAWMNFEIGYQVALKNMPIKKKDSTFKDHWLFTQGNRRGLMYGVLSRCFYRVDLSIDDSLEDKYELTKFVIDNPERFRHLTWRAYSMQKHIVRGVLKGEKKVVDERGSFKDKSKYYSEIAKAISKLGSVKLLDSISEEEIADFVYKEYINLLHEDVI